MCLIRLGLGRRVMAGRPREALDDARRVSSLGVTREVKEDASEGQAWRSMRARGVRYACRIRWEAPTMAKKKPRQSTRNSGGQSTQEPIDLGRLSGYLHTISRSFAVIALRLSPVRAATGARRAQFLDALGLDVGEIAAIVGSDPQTVRTQLTPSSRTPRATGQRKRRPRG